MSKSPGIMNRRFGVVLNLIGLIGVIFSFYHGYLYEWSLFHTITLGISLAILLFSFLRYYIVTGLWRFVHTGSENLDERQIAVSRESLRYAYSIFTIISLVILLAISLYSGKEINLIVIFASLLYLAHTLPAAIIAWTEKEI